jgi:hypothetical protein
MRNLIIFMLLCLTISTSAQKKLEITGNPPIIPMIKFGYVKTYEPPYLLKPEVKAKAKSNTSQKFKGINPVNSNPKQDSITAEVMRLLNLYGKQIADLKTPVVKEKDTNIVNVSIVVKKDSVPPIKMHILTDTGLRQLSKDKRCAYGFIASGVIIPLIGGTVFVNTYEGTTITNNIKVTATKVKVGTLIDTHKKDNIKAGVFLGASVFVGTIMEVIGFRQLDRVKVTADGLTIPLFYKKNKHK